ncbi:MAG: hypothetical protein HXX16_12630 [Bacteroidales bacterium]|nr:hypothetical protein [Bacteroidales bacterium]
MYKYKKLIIYYFSGTGNSRKVAIWLSIIAKQNDIDVQIINIASIDKITLESPHSEALLVFISPIHGFNYPPVMLHFIRKFPKGTNKIVLMNTRAGMLIGNYITPGLTGIAFYLSSLIFKFKGYSTVGMIPFDMPSNWISFHPGLNYRTIKYLHEKNKEKVFTAAERILSGRLYFKALREIIQDIIVLPISLLYYFIGRFGLAKTFYSSSDCNDCDICIKNCPVKAIIKVDSRPFWTFKCESCMRCMGNCPKKAIETAHGFFIGFILMNSAITALFFKYCNIYFAEIGNGIIRFIAESLIFLLLLTIFHRIIHYCMRFKIIERIIVYTSLTKYKFWGRCYKALKEI